MLACSVGSKVAKRAATQDCCEQEGSQSEGLQAWVQGDWRAPHQGSSCWLSPSRSSVVGHLPSMHKALPSRLSTREREKCLNHQVNSAGRFPKGKSLRLLRRKKITYSVWNLGCFMQMSAAQVNEGKSACLWLFKQATSIKDCTTCKQGRGGSNFLNFYLKKNLSLFCWNYLFFSLEFFMPTFSSVLVKNFRSGECVEINTKSAQKSGWLPSGAKVQGAFIPQQPYISRFSAWYIFLAIY